MKAVESILSLEPLGGLGLLVSLFLGYQMLKMIYNISPLHPLSPIPGPKLSAASYLPEFYYDVICLGRYTHNIREMHEKYGPVVRINPHEVHCNDPGFVDEIYAVGGRKRDKPLHQVKATVATETEFGTVDHDHHRSRRAPVAKFFSRSNIMKLESEIGSHAQRLCDKIMAQSGSGKPFDITIAYSNLAADVVSGYCFGESFGLLGRPGWDLNFREPNLSTIKYWFLFRFFPFLKNLAELGVWFINYLPQDLALFVYTMQVDIPKRVKKTTENLKAAVIYDRPILVGALLNSSLSDVEKRPARIALEALGVVGAGTETTSWCLSVITYHVLTKPLVFETLTQELTEAVPDPLCLPPWAALEKLPYLNSVIQEGLRLSYGVPGRTARVPTQEDLVYRGEWDKKRLQYLIPRGYAIGMSAAISHHDESLFPESHSFRPERWLDPQRRKELDRGMLVFSKGTRACLGMNLGLCELHLALAALTLRVLPHMRLYETSEEDIIYDWETLVPMPKHGSLGVRATIV